jgi:hypothetical protein
VARPKKNNPKKRLNKSAAQSGVVKDTTFRQGLADGFERSRARVYGHKMRRPHRSFRLTRRRDYNRSFKMPGYLGFTKYVLGQLRKSKWSFRLLTLFSVVAIALLVGIMSQDMYSSLQDALAQTSENIVGGQVGEVGKAALLLLSTATTGGLNQSPTEVQQVFTVLIFMIIWLTTVWLLRNQLSGNKVRLRDGLYNACAPLISTALVVLVLFVQLIPAIVALVAYSAAVATDFLATPLYAVVFWMAAGGLGLLSLFLVTSTIFALVVVTIPGMYPFAAIKISGDLVTSRRLRVILRLVWMALNILVFWVITMIPIIIFDSWFKGVAEWASGWPIVSIALLIVSSMSIIFASSYIYLLYRRLIDDAADPA